MKAVLLDTHVLVWAVSLSQPLSQSADAAIQAADQAWVSVVSLYEIDFKRNRRAHGAGPLQSMPANLLSGLTSIGLKIQPLTAAQAIAAARLDIAHGDPWDRILVAQARDLGVPLISADARLRREAPDTVIW